MANPITDAQRARNVIDYNGGSALPGHTSRRLELAIRRLIGTIRKDERRRALARASSGCCDGCTGTDCRRHQGAQK